MNLEAQLRSYGDEVERRALAHGDGADDAGVAGADLPGAEVVHPVEPARRGRSRALVAAAALVVVVVGLAAVLVASRSATDVAGVDTGPAVVDDGLAPDGTDGAEAPVPDTGVAAPDPGAPPFEPEAPVWLWLSATRAPEGAELVAVLVNRSGDDVLFGVDASIERWDGSTWQEVGRLAMCLDHWFCTAPVARPGDPFGVEDIGMSAEPGGTATAERFTTAGLAPGWYRVSQTMHDGVVATGVFEVAADAPVPPPLIPIDAPAISVRPVLVPPAGTVAELSPLVPPVGGGSSRGAVEQAIAGLDEVARIERWDGAGWSSVVEVPLGPSEWDTIARSLAIPALGEGAYRLVRTGPAGDHTGGFWVVDLDGRQRP
jgi:hypothetical protein